LTRVSIFFNTCSLPIAVLCDELKSASPIEANQSLRTSLTKTQKGTKMSRTRNCVPSGGALRRQSQHGDIPTGEKPFACDQCDKAFNWKKDLRIHKCLHSEEMTIYQCHLCDKMFGTTSNLNRHRLIHCEDTLFHCDQCDRAFKRKDSLNRHFIIIHSGEKPFKCDECDKAFKEVGKLAAHKRIHTGEKPFRCRQCHKMFMWGSSFYKHRQRVHPDPLQ
jgi:KRAB domain-containing zinc finger protein